MTARDRRAIGAGAVALLLGVALGAAPSGCGFHTSGLETTTGAGGMTSSSSSSSSSGAMCTIASDCKGDGDCVTWTCANHACASVPVTAGTKCAGGVCDNTGACVGCFVVGAVTTGCAAAEYCFANACASCTDTMVNGDETDVDCGGAHCGVCDDLKVCQKGADCMSGICNTGATPPVCISCKDGVKDGSETDVDCGGTCTTLCGLGQKCLSGADCTSMECPAGKCTDCHNNMQDVGETGVDCGGSCLACNGDVCTSGAGCKSGSCVLGICCDTACQVPTSSKCQSCALSGKEGTCTNIPSGVDGMPTCGAGNVCDGSGGMCQGVAAKKPIGQACGGGGECFNGNCKLGYCRLKPGDHCDAAVECDTDFCSPQHVCASCAGAADCATTQCGGGNCCMGGHCKLPDSAVCGADPDCAVGKCTVGVCGLPVTAGCSAGADCRSGHCDVTNHCGPCLSDGDCGANGKCLFPGPTGVCQGAPSDYCQFPADCVSQMCVPSPIFLQCK
jgi:hypothetical protein